MAKLYSTESKVGLEKNNGERLTEPPCFRHFLGDKKLIA